MKIAFAVPAYWPSIIGVSLYCQELAEGLIKRGHEVTVFTGQQPGWPSEEERKGVKIRRFDRKYIFGGAFYFVPGLADAVAESRPDIVHSHHYGYYEATAGLQAAKKLGKPHVFGPYYHPPIYGTKKKLLAKMYHLRYGKPLLQQSARIFPHTNYESDLLVKAGAKAEAIRLLPNTVNTRVFKPCTKKAKTILFVSNLITEKGAGVAMDLAKQLLAERKDAKFVFKGGHYDPRLAEKIKELSGNSRVRFITKVLGQRELARLYSSAAVIILPSQYEAFSKVLAEAQACGTAVVATKVGGIPEVVEDGKSGFLIDYGDWENLKQKVEQLLDDLSLAKKMGVAGWQRVVKNFDTEKVVDRLEKIYGEILANSSP